MTTESTPDRAADPRSGPNQKPKMHEGDVVPSPDPADLQSDKSMMRRAVTAAAVGNMVEWYDFGVYGFLAGTVGSIFFPSNDATVSLLAAFATFAIAFVMRPLGAFFFGPLGDRVGRKRVLATTILLMSGATLAIGLLPGYATIGILAPVLLVLCRLAQGFSTGGEYGGAATFVSEHAPVKRRGFVTSWLEFSSLVGFALGASLATVLTLTLSDSAMTSWGWRIPFLLAGPLGLIGLYLRLRLEDTPNFKALVQAKEVAKSPLRESLKNDWGGMLRVLGISTMANSGQYMIFTYMPNYLSSDESLELTSSAALMVVLAAIVLMMILITRVGALSDRVGRRPVMLASGIGLFVLTYPALLLISLGNWFAVSLGVAVLAVLVVSNMGPLPSTLAALFPTRTRYSGFSVGYNVGVAVFGGTTPFIATYLVSVTGNSLAPAFYLMATATAGIVAILLSEESARVPLKQV
jgi:MHS family proline/betaine transporter-like MFS transporter